jgi:hypothetical protein
MNDDDNAANKNYHRRVAEEMAEADEPRNRHQAFLDRCWQAHRDEAIEHRRLLR